MLVNEDPENDEKKNEDAENERQMRLMQEMENGGEIEDIDLTTEDWVNVNPAEITKRYDMLIKYVSLSLIF